MQPIQVPLATLRTEAKRSSRAALARKYKVPEHVVLYALKHRKGINYLPVEAKSAPGKKLSANARKIAEANAMLNGHSALSNSDKLARVGRNIVDLGMAVIELAREIEK